MMVESSGILWILPSPMPLIVRSKPIWVGVSHLTSVPRAKAKAVAMRLAASAILLLYATGASCSCSGGIQIFVSAEVAKKFPNL